jgi:hypothetical protein
VNLDESLDCGPMLDNGPHLPVLGGKVAYPPGLSGSGIARAFIESQVRAC